MKQLLRLAAAVGIAAAAPTPAEAASWRAMSIGGSGGDRQVFFVDADSIRRAGSVIQFRDMMVRETPTPRGVTVAVESVRLDCRDQSSVSSNLSFYGRGQLMFTHPGDGKAEQYEEGSAFRVLTDSLCAGELPVKVAANPESYAREIFAR